MKRALVLGSGGFIGGHLTNLLMNEGYRVTGCDIKHHEYGFNPNKFVLGDLRDAKVLKKLFKKQYDRVYQLAADMGGAGFVFTGVNDADIMHNSAQINLNVLDAVTKYSPKSKVFYSSSACIYPEHNQLDPHNPVCNEASAYPANPDSDYGWEKLFSERLYEAYARNKGLDIHVARFHNIFGPQGTYDGGREKAPAAMCRKVALAKDGDEIEIWGDGKQTRSFLYVDECIEGIQRLMNSDVRQPLNIGSDEMVTINQLAEMVIAISGKTLTLKHITGPQGVRGRCSDNELISKELSWKPSEKLIVGLQKTYNWIKERVSNE